MPITFDLWCTDSIEVQGQCEAARTMWSLWKELKVINYCSSAKVICENGDDLWYDEERICLVGYYMLLYLNFCISFELNVTYYFILLSYVCAFYDFS